MKSNFFPNIEEIYDLSVDRLTEIKNEINLLIDFYEKENAKSGLSFKEIKSLNKKEVSYNKAKKTLEFVNSELNSRNNIDQIFDYFEKESSWKTIYTKFFEEDVEKKDELIEKLKFEEINKNQQDQKDNFVDLSEESDKYKWLQSKKKVRDSKWISETLKKTKCDVNVKMFVGQQTLPLIMKKKIKEDDYEITKKESFKSGIDEKDKVEKVKSNKKKKKIKLVQENINEPKELNFREKIKFYSENEIPKVVLVKKETLNQDKLKLNENFQFGKLNSIREKIKIPPIVSKNQLNSEKKTSDLDKIGEKGKDNFLKEEQKDVVELKLKENGKTSDSKTQSVDLSTNKYTLCKTNQYGTDTCDNNNSYQTNQSKNFNDSQKGDCKNLENIDFKENGMLKHTGNDKFNSESVLKLEIFKDSELTLNTCAKVVKSQQRETDIYQRDESINYLHESKILKKYSQLSIINQISFDILCDKFEIENVKWNKLSSILEKENKNERSIEFVNLNDIMIKNLNQKEKSISISINKMVTSPKIEIKTNVKESTFSTSNNNLMLESKNSNKEISDPKNLIIDEKKENLVIIENKKLKNSNSIRSFAKSNASIEIDDKDSNLEVKGKVILQNIDKFLKESQDSTLTNKQSKSLKNNQIQNTKLPNTVLRQSFKKTQPIIAKETQKYEENEEFSDDPENLKEELKNNIQKKINKKNIEKDTKKENSSLSKIQSNAKMLKTNTNFRRTSDSLFRTTKTFKETRSKSSRIVKLLKQPQNTFTTDYTNRYSCFLEIFSGYYLTNEYKNFDYVNIMREIKKNFLSLCQYELNDYNDHDNINTYAVEAETEVIKGRLKRVADRLLSDNFNYTEEQFFIFKKILELQKKEYGRKQLTDDKIEGKMFFRVVLSRPEIYDIMCYTLGIRPEWRELPHGLDLGNSWNLLWTYSTPKIEFNKLLSFQKVNHFINNRNISRKDLLKRSIDRIRKMNIKLDKLFDIQPTTFILAKDYVDFSDEFAKGKKQNPAKNLWIVKPVGKSRGHGIFLVNDLTDVPLCDSFLVQRYLTNPLLLDGFKFDMRIYVVVTSFNPLEAFIYEDGFARLSNLPFNTANDDIKNRLIHLTNAAVQNKVSKASNTCEKIFGGSKISLDLLKQKLKRNNVDFDFIWKQSKEIILKSLIACQYDIPYCPSCFELFGYDIIVDSDLKCWLLEVNSSPSLERTNVLDDDVKLNLVDDILNLVEPINYDRNALVAILERRISQETRTTVGSNNNTYLYSQNVQMNLDLNQIFKGEIPRKFGEKPQKCDKFEMISPTKESEYLIKISGGQKLFNKSKPIQANTFKKKK